MGVIELHEACGFAGKAVAGSQWRYVDADGAVEPARDEGLGQRMTHFTII